MSAPAGAINAWECPDCHKSTVAVHVDEGVTPMFLACRSTPGCEGRAISVGYGPPPDFRAPVALELVAWEWRKATTTELKRWKRDNPEMHQHCMMGGLVIAPLSDRGRAALP